MAGPTDSWSHSRLAVPRVVEEKPLPLLSQKTIKKEKPKGGRARERKRKRRCLLSPGLSLSVPPPLHPRIPPPPRSHRVRPCAAAGARAPRALGGKGTKVTCSSWTLRSGIQQGHEVKVSILNIRCDLDSFFPYWCDITKLKLQAIKGVGSS